MNLIKVSCKVCGKTHQTMKQAELFIKHFCSKNHAEKWLDENCESYENVNDKLQEKGFD